MTTETKIDPREGVLPVRVLYTGRKLYHGNVQPEDITVEDLIYPISRIPRFMGGTTINCSIGQHQTWCAYQLTDIKQKRKALIHDMHEGHQGDWPTPLKRSFPILNEIEDSLERPVNLFFGIDPDDEETNAAVKKIDTLSLLWERQRNLPNKGEDHLWPPTDLEIPEYPLIPLLSAEVRISWLFEYFELFGADKLTPELAEIIHSSATRAVSQRGSKAYGIYLADDGKSYTPDTVTWTSYCGISIGRIWGGQMAALDTRDSDKQVYCKQLAFPLD